MQAKNAKYLEIFPLYSPMDTRQITPEMYCTMPIARSAPHALKPCNPGNGWASPQALHLATYLHRSVSGLDK
jgi:hypothetical protein